jgi:GxxExxY protein
MNENEIVTIIIDKSMEIHRNLGPGLFENAYESILSFELLDLGLGISRQETIPIKWKTLTIDEAYRADLIVEDKVIVEIKSVEKLTKAHEKQMLTYLRLSGKKLGLLLNFGQPLLKDGIERIINGKIEPTAGHDGLFR